MDDDLADNRAASANGYGSRFCQLDQSVKLGSSRTSVQAYLPRRWVGVLGFLTMFTVIWWLVVNDSIAPKLTTPTAVPNVDQNDVHGSMGKPVHLDGLVHVADLDPKFLPQERSRQHGKQSLKRLVMIGDIHGCKQELLSLLEAVSYKPETDHIITTGDILNKGPDSSGVIDFLINEGASCVRGNNEDNILRLLAEIDTSAPGKDMNASSGKGEEKDAQDRRLARALTNRQLQYIRSFPLVLRIEYIPGLDTKLIVVHAGLVPGIKLEEQDPFSVMNMRLIDPTSNTPPTDHERKGSVPWFEVWNKHQMKQPKVRASVNETKGSSDPTRTTIIYGHDAKRGLQIHDYTKGLDSSCVRGGQLTALVISAGGTQEIFQVSCADHKNLQQL